MERKFFSKAPCSIARSLDVLGDWWTPLIIRDCLYGVRRFDEFQRGLAIGRNILARRLALLVEEGILEKRQYADRPARYEYELTEKGYDAAKLVVAMMAFGEAWYFAPGQEPIWLHDRRTGERVRPLVVDSRTGNPIDVRQVYAAPGPSFPRGEKSRKERFREHYARREAKRSGNSG